MARLTGPLGSLEAHGKLAGILSYGKNQGGSYARKSPVERYSQSHLQRSCRAMLAFLSSHWLDALTNTDRASWEPLAAARTISPQQAYLRHNLQRWGNWKSPSVRYPPGGLQTNGFLLPQPTPTGQTGRVKWTWTALTIGNWWGMRIHRYPTTPFPSNRNSLSTVLLLNATGPHTAYELDVPPGTWFYNVVPFHKNGQTSTTVYNKTTTVQ